LWLDTGNDIHFRCPKHFETVSHYVPKCLILSPNVPGHVPKMSHDNTGYRGQLKIITQFMIQIKARLLAKNSSYQSEYHDVKNAKFS
ncbi:7198_t:CDS:2, partial [Funneliformis geosporum]